MPRQRVEVCGVIPEGIAGCISNLVTVRRVTAIIRDDSNRRVFPRKPTRIYEVYQTVPAIRVHVHPIAVADGAGLEEPADLGVVAGEVVVQAGLGVEAAAGEQVGVRVVRVPRADLAPDAVVAWELMKDDWRLMIVGRGNPPTAGVVLPGERVHARALGRGWVRNGDSRPSPHAISVGAEPLGVNRNPASGAGHCVCIL